MLNPRSTRAMFIGAMISVCVYSAVIAYVTSSCSGCAEKGSDPILVHSEQAMKVSHDTIKAAIDFDAANRAYMRDKLTGVHDAIEDLRRTEPELTRSAWKAHDEYKATRSVEDGEALNNILAALQAAEKEARSYLIQAKALPATRPTTK